MWPFGKKRPHKVVETEEERQLYLRGLLRKPNKYFEWITYDSDYDSEHHRVIHNTPGFIYDYHYHDSACDASDGHYSSQTELFIPSLGVMLNGERIRKVDESRYKHPEGSNYADQPLIATVQVPDEVVSAIKKFTKVRDR